MANIYQANPYQKEVETVLVKSLEENGKFVVQIDDNIFHPHGGGQKGDRGGLVINGAEYKVVNTIKDKSSYLDEALLVLEEGIPISLVGQKVTASLDWNFRYRQMRLHTALHLHHCMLEKVLGKSLAPPKTADIEDGFAFNRYEDNSFTEADVEQANQELISLIQQGAGIQRHPDAEKVNFWWWECLSYKIPCGGTHVRDVSELGDIAIQYSTKKGKPNVKITLK